MDVGELRFAELLDYVERTFRHVAEAKGVGFEIEVGPRRPALDLHRLDALPAGHQEPALQRLQVHRERRRSRCASSDRAEGWSPQIESLNRARSVLAVSVTDTGIGISPEKQQIIFEAFQQADG